ncbi:MAG: SDR family NAD(P)-dependent oxidoreductase [Acetobacteraceae bacterium]|nr:SDR family NAD(P)-dependent oxidoreductase [Acetobacteraceae bacterium]
MKGSSIAAPALLRSAPILVTGGAGFIGCNLADRLAAEGNEVLVFDSLARPGVAANLAWLKRRHPRLVGTMIADIRDEAAVRAAVARATAVFHLAAQVAVTTSMTDPRADFDVNVLGTMLLLDAMRRRGERTPLIFASTNKVYGDLSEVALADDGERYLPRDPDLRAHGIGEVQPISFHTPYGCSKGAADQYVLDFARSFGLPTSVLRMSCIYGRRQRGTEDQGWVAHFLLRALAGEPVTIYGDGRQVRDILFVDDAVAAYLAAWRQIGAVSGRAFNLGGGPRNAVSLLQLLRCIEHTTGTSVDVRYADWRPGDQRYFVSDTRLLSRTLDLAPPLSWRDGVATLAACFQQERREPSRRVAGAAD